MTVPRTRNKSKDANNIFLLTKAWLDLCHS